MVRILILIFLIRFVKLMVEINMVDSFNEKFMCMVFKWRNRKGIVFERLNIRCVRVKDIEWGD